MTRPATERELRDWLARRLKKPKVPDKLWAELEEERFVAAALDDEDGLRDLLDVARRRMLRIQRPGRPPKSGAEVTKVDVKPLVPRPEALRSRVFSAYLGKLASEDYDLRRFREDFLGGKPVSGEEAQQLVKDRDLRRELERASERVARNFHWNQVQAKVFIMTGRVPLISAVSVGHQRMWAKHFTHFRVTIEVEPWVSPQTVLRVYRDSQRELLGRQSRQLSERNLTLFHFITDRIPVNAKKTAWRAMMTEWNRAHPDWEYGDARHFARDYHRTGRIVALLGYAPPAEEQ